MKFVFYDSGDYLEFEPENNPLIDSWLNYIFSNSINNFKLTSSNRQEFVNNLNQLNESIRGANKFALQRIANFTPFDEITELNQSALNAAHKHWAYCTDRYSQEIFPAPCEWEDVNTIIHRLEGYFTASFKPITDNFNLKFLDKKLIPKLKPEYFDYHQHDLVLTYNNLGRHQYNQWLLGSMVDFETNNYKVISTEFNYVYDPEVNPKVLKNNPPPGYEEWCKEYNLEVLPPWAPIGRFKNYHRDEVKKIMYRNLGNNNNYGFSEN